MTFVAVAMFVAVAAAGTLARIQLGVLGDRFGYLGVGTLAANLLGSFAAGLVVGGGATGSVAVIALIGGLGAFTTMSTFAGEIVRLVDDQQWATAGVYAALTVGGAIAMASLGMALTG